MIKKKSQLFVLGKSTKVTSKSSSEKFIPKNKILNLTWLGFVGFLLPEIAEAAEKQKVKKISQKKSKQENAVNESKTIDTSVVDGVEKEGAESQSKSKGDTEVGKAFSSDLILNAVTVKAKILLDDDPLNFPEGTLGNLGLVIESEQDSLNQALDHVRNTSAGINLEKNLSRGKSGGLLSDEQIHLQRDLQSRLHATDGINLSERLLENEFLTGFRTEQVWLDDVVKSARYAQKNIDFHEIKDANLITKILLQETDELVQVHAYHAQAQKKILFSGDSDNNRQLFSELLTSENKFIDIQLGQVSSQDGLIQFFNVDSLSKNKDLLVPDLLVSENKYIDAQLSSLGNADGFIQFPIAGMSQSKLGSELIDSESSLVAERINGISVDSSRIVFSHLIQNIDEAVIKTITQEISSILIGFNQSSTIDGEIEFSFTELAAKDISALLNDQSNQLSSPLQQYAEAFIDFSGDTRGAVDLLHQVFIQEDTFAQARC